MAVLGEQSICYMHKQNCNVIHDHYGAIVDMIPENIIQQYEIEAQVLICHLNQKCAEMMVPNSKYISRAEVKSSRSCTTGKSIYI